MIEVKLNVDTSTQVTEIVNELKNKGYILHADFDFMYRPPKYDDMNCQLLYTKHILFRFYKDELATWFTLAYG